MEARQREYRFAMIRGGTAWVKVTLAFVVFLLLALGIQRAASASSAAFGAFPDEPAHFLGGLMIHDYLTDASGKDPIRFAENYHLHLPYIGLGAWPPLFYVLEGSWMKVFGPTRTSVLWMIAISAAGLATLLYGILERHFDSWTALAGGAILLLVPVVQWSTCVTMVDVSCSLFALAAVVYFARFMEHQRWRDSVMFGILSGVALLTKNSTYFVVFVPPIAIAASRRWDLLRTRALWIAPLLVAGLYGPWLLVSRPFLLLGIQGVTHAGFFAIQWDYILTLWQQTSFLLILASAGVIFLVSRRHRPLSPLSLCMLAVIPAISIGIFIGRVPVQGRLLIVSYSAIVFFVGAFWDALLGPSKRPVAMLACLVIFGILNWQHFQRLPVNNLRGPIALLQAKDGKQPGAVLVPSSIEGPWIAEFAQSEVERPLRILLRPTKLFGEEDWNGTNWRPRYTTIDEIKALFERAPVKYCILTDSNKGKRYPHDELLESIMAASPSDWHLIFQTADQSTGGYRIYENAHWTAASEPLVLNELRRLSPNFLR